MGSLTPPIGDDRNLVSLTPHGHYLLRPGLSIGGRLPLVHASNEAESGSSLGNLSAELDLSLHQDESLLGWASFSLSLPTASSSGAGGAAAADLSRFWLADPGLYAPDTITVRATYHLRLGTQGDYLQVGAGLYYLKAQEGDDRALVPVALSGRVALGERTAAIGRLDTIWNLDAGNDDDKLAHTLTIGLAIARLGKGHAELGFYLPLDERYRQDEGMWGFVLSYSMPLGTEESRTDAAGR